MKRLLACGLVVLMSWSTANAQLSFDVPSLSPARVLANVKTLNLKFQHSYSMMYSSSAWGSGLSGMYLNTMDYHFKIPLQISMTWGFQTVLSGYGQTRSPRFVLPQLNLRYHPFKSLWIEVNYRHNTTPYYSPFDTDLWNDRLF